MIASERIQNERNNRPVDELVQSMKIVKEQATLKYHVKDSVFTDLFRIPKYTLELYHVLHPEDNVTTEQDIQIVTLENIFINQLYNDLGFAVGGRLMILVEAQSTWTVNIVPRMLLYAAECIERQVIENKINLYSSKKAELMKPEFYVIYTGERKEHPETISLSRDIFNDSNSDLDLTVHMLYGSEKNDILSQYVSFTTVLRSQVKKFGRTREAVMATIEICKDKNVLKNYLESRESEVIGIMSLLYDFDTILNCYTHDVEQEARAEGKAEGRAEGKAEGKAEGMFSTLFQLVKNGLISTADAASSASVSESAFREKMAAYPV